MIRQLLLGAKDYLHKLYQIRDHILASMLHLEHLRELISSVSMKRPVVCGGINSNYLPDYNAELVNKTIDLEAHILLEIDNYAKYEREAIRRIELIPDPLLRDILLWHYVDFEPWGIIANKLSCTERWVYGLRQKALEAFSDKNKLISHI